jgi:hypothetical protein
VKTKQQIREDARAAREAELQVLAQARRTADLKYVADAAGFWLRVLRMIHGYSGDPRPRHISPFFLRM